MTADSPLRGWWCRYGGRWLAEVCWLAGAAIEIVDESNETRRFRETHLAKTGKYRKFPEMDFATS
jgi:hypothetical protein